MSGGHFSYDQYKIGYIADAIDNLILKNGKPKRKEDIYSWDDSDTTYYEYPPEVIEKFKEAVITLRIAECYAHRIDWLVSSDDSEDSFFRRLEEDLKEVREKYTQKYFENLEQASLSNYYED
jgi:hypothetical protein